MKPNASRLGLLAALAAALLIPEAHAQILPGPGLGSKAARPSGPASPPPPPALPGARVDREMVAPPDRAPSDLQPNEALFDSINRGDIAAARDALSRGATLSATNVLGMTPLDLSIDLGRKDISFLLLSMRGSGGSAGAPPSAPKTADAKPAKPAKPGRVQKAERRSAAATLPVAPPAAPQTPRLFAGDGGAPVPNAGFLGFDASGRAQR
jgi:hypothetical protein